MHVGTIERESLGEIRERIGGWWRFVCFLGDKLHSS